MSAVPADLKKLEGAMPEVRLIRASDVRLEPVRWLWHGYLPAGMFTIIGGAPGCGKTTIALSLAAIITRGGVWPDGSRCKLPGDVIVWSGEDSREVLAPRLLASSADMERVSFIDGMNDGSSFDPGNDAAILEETMAKLPAPRLLILDPIVSAVSGDGHKSNDVRRGLQPIVELAQRVGCAVVGITHFTKGTAGRDPIERVTGSIAFAALARLVLVASKVQPEPGDESEPRRVLMRAKSNIGPDDGGFAYALERVAVAPDVEGQRVHWLDAVSGSAREVLAEADADQRDDGADDVTGFLRTVLADGAMSAKAVLAEASGAGYSRDQVQRAARRLGVDRQKDGMHGGWRWYLPRAEGGSRLAQLPEGGTEDGEGSEDGSPQGVPPSGFTASEGGTLSSPPPSPSSLPSAPPSAPADDAEVI